MKTSSTQDIKKSAVAAQAPYRTTTSQHGFTLIEIMAAISIIAIVLVSVYKLHAQSVAMTSEVRFYATAPMLAQKKMAELESKSRKDISDESGDFGDQFPNYSFNIVINDVESEALGNVTENLKRIDITVSFNKDEYTYDLRNYRLFQD